MEIEYDKDILPFRDNDPEWEVFDCCFCHEPISEEEAINLETDLQMYEHCHPLCLKKYDPWYFWMARFVG